MNLERKHRFLLLKLAKALATKDAAEFLWLVQAIEKIMDATLMNS